MRVGSSGKSGQRIPKCPEFARIECMKFGIYLTFILLLSVVVAAQDRNSPDNQPHITPKNMPPPKENVPPDVAAGEAPGGESSSKESQIDKKEKRPTQRENDAS